MLKLLIIHDLKHLNYGVPQYVSTCCFIIYFCEMCFMLAYAVRQSLYRSRSRTSIHFCGSLPWLAGLHRFSSACTARHSVAVSTQCKCNISVNWRVNKRRLTHLMNNHVCLCVADDKHCTTSDYNTMPLSAEPRDALRHHTSHELAANTTQTRYK